MDNVRNITGDPVAGIDADELFDTRELVCQVQDMITNNGEGNPAFSNLPRKFNIAIGVRQPAEINDLALFPPIREQTQGSNLKASQFGFNVIVGFFPPNAVMLPFPSMPG